MFFPPILGFFSLFPGLAPPAIFLDVSAVAWGRSQGPCLTGVPSSSPSFRALVPSAVFSRFLVASRLPFSAGGVFLYAPVEKSGRASGLPCVLVGRQAPFVALCDNKNENL